jgi:mono/diheme cytochrome c family protein
MRASSLQPPNIVNTTGLMMRLSTFSLALSAALALTACSSGSAPAAPTAPATAASPMTAATPATAAPAPATEALSPAAEAEQKFTTLCATCHGANGMGDGAASASLNPKPRAYSDQAWQASVTDEHLKTVIVKGGPAVGKSALMPPSPDLESKPEVVAELVKKIRSYKK